MHHATPTFSEMTRLLLKLSRCARERAHRHGNHMLQLLLMVETDHAHKTPLKHLSHLKGARGQRLVAPHGPVPIPLPALEPDLEDVSAALDEVGVLEREGELEGDIQETGGREGELV